ncbi:MAG: T9SS type A sorting domain-containing protein [Bacteroidota bacterium]|nr:T9SS type A sorting domain-containing protein [Bacteroidota bacterium]
MKKGYLILMLLGTAIFAQAQTSQSPVQTRDFNPLNPARTNQKIVVNQNGKKQTITSNKTNAPMVSALYDYKQALIDYDQQSTATPTFTQPVMMLPDTAFTIITRDYPGTADTAWTFNDYSRAYTNGALAYSFSVGFTLDARSLVWSLSANNDYLQLGRYNVYTIDSIQFPYYYIRSTDGSVTDKLNLQYLNNSNFKVKGGFGSPGPTPAYPEVGMPNYDHTANKAPNATVEKTFDLTINDTNSQDDARWLTLTVNKAVNTNSGQISAVVASFEPGTSHNKVAPFDSLGADSFNGAPITNRFNQFYYKFVYDQTRVFEDNQNISAPNKVYQNGLFIPGALLYDLYPPASSLHDVYFPGTLIYTRTQGTERVPVFPIFRYYISCTNIGIADLENKGFMLGEVYPNPSNGQNVRIPFELAKTANINISIYNNLGQVVKTVANGQFAQGVNGVDVNTSDLNSGVYHYTLNMNGFSTTQRFVVSK